MAQSAKEKLLAFITDQGWTLDPTQTVPANPSRFGSTEAQRLERKQDPHAFIRPAKEDNHVWAIKLHYGGGYGSSNTLKSVYVALRDAEGAPRNGMKRYSVLRNVEAVRYRNFPEVALWEALKDKGEKTGSLTDAVKKLVTDPDTAVWLAIQWDWDDKEERRVSLEQAEAARLRRARPLPVVVDQKGYYSQWGQIAAKLENAARAIVRANGESNLPQLVADAQLALEGIQSALTDEAQQAAEAIVAEEHHMLNEGHSERLRAFLTGESS